MDSDRDRQERDLKDEIAFHLAAETERRIAAGHTPDQARTAARRAFGNVALVEDVTRNMWGPTIMRERLLHDIRFAARLLVRDPSFTAVALTTLSLGIAATITVFAVLKAVLLNPLPFPEPDRLVMVWERTPGGGEQRNVTRAYSVLQWQARNQSFEHLAGMMPLPANVAGIGDAEQVDGFSVIGEFFDALGVKAQIGRTLTGRDTPNSVVISHGFWQQRLGGAPDAVGRLLMLNGLPREVVGVMPAGFAFPAARAVQVYVPFPVDPAAPPGGRNMITVARLKTGVSLEAARADMRRVVQQMIDERSPAVTAGWSASVFPLFDETVTSVRRILWVVLAAVSCLLLLACANVANLLLIRASKRAHELAVRVALGAGRWRLVHQIAAESALLAIIAGAIGLGIAMLAVPAIPSLFPETFPLPRSSEVTIDRSMVAYTLLLCGAIAGGFSLLPVVRVARERFAGVLHAGGRSAVATHSRLRRSLVVAEVTIALVLVLAATLMGRSLVELTNVDPGFEADRILTLRMLMLPSKYRGPAAVPFLNTVLGEVRATPGVVSASSIHFLPLSGVASISGVYRTDRPAPPREQIKGSPVSVITDGYFKAMGIPLSGRDFNATDSLVSPTVVIINQALARELFANENPIGKHIYAGYSPRTMSMEIVGVAGDVRTSTLDQEPGPAIYIAHTQEPSLLASLVVRTQSSPALAVDAVRKAIARADPEQGVSQVQPMETLIANASARPRVQASVFVMFGALALIIAAVGLYGVMAYGVEQRRREIGLQLALGALPRTVLGAVVREGVVLAGIGVAAGAALAWISSGALEGLLYDTRPTDPMIFVAAAATLMAVACLATLAPAFRATRVDPLVVLREE
jgi:putative ABC transport system permease protein